MKILIAPDKFKGCLTANQVARAIAAGLRNVDPSMQLDECPMADGGEGTVAALVAATGGRIETRRVVGPLPQMQVDAQFGILGDGQTAVIEMAAASGLALLKPRDRNPMNTTTYGTGQLLMAAAEMGMKKIILGIGGSATVDAGLGCAQACGLPIVLRDGLAATDRPLTGGDLADVVEVGNWGSEIGGRGSEKVFLPTPDPRSPTPFFIVACDVTNPLYGPNGAAPVFAPQKGATPEQALQLDDALRQLAYRLGKTEQADTPGSGAAGGLGFAMLAFFNARLSPGIEIVIQATRLRDRLADADLCITGEGRLDSQSLSGKTAIGVARLCKEMNVPCIALVGAIGEGADAALSEGIIAYFSIMDRPMTLDEAMRDAPRLLEAAAGNVVRTILRGSGKLEGVKFE